MYVQTGIFSPHNGHTVKPEPFYCSLSTSVFRFPNAKREASKQASKQQVIADHCKPIQAQTPPS